MAIRADSAEHTTVYPEPSFSSSMRRKKLAGSGNEIGRQRQMRRRKDSVRGKGLKLIRSGANNLHFRTE